jgi:DNA (cytosine-5)-methyltransferase 1
MDENKIRGLDLFSGIGGISLALSPWVKTVAYCECEPYAQAVLLERMQSGDLDIAPIWDDVRTLGKNVFDTSIDIIFGGFPCQNISVAGNGEGLAGKQSNLFFEIVRLAKEYRPVFIFLENVPAITSRGLDTIARKIASLRYDCRWGVLSAYDMGAPHIRERWFLLAHANSLGLEKPKTEHGAIRETFPQSCTHILSKDWQDPWATILRNDARVPYRMERIKALGNSVVPQAAREAFIKLSGINKV